MHKVYCSTRKCPLSTKCQMKDETAFDNLNVSVVKYEFIEEEDRVTCSGFKEKPTINITYKS